MVRECAAERNPPPLHVPASYNMPVLLKPIAIYIKLSDDLQAKARKGKTASSDTHNGERDHVWV